MITLDELNSATDAQFATLLAGVFEHAVWVAPLAAAARPFATVTTLHEGLMDVVRRADADTQRRFLGLHPALSSAATIALGLTAESQGEQAGLRLAGLGATAGEFTAKADDYTAKFGFPFIICARRYTPAATLRALNQRLASTEAQERATAIGEVFFISRLRLTDRVTGPGVPRTTGRVAVEILDASGAPISDANIALYRDGARIAGAVSANEPLRMGAYEVRGQIPGVSPYYDTIAVPFDVSDPEGDYDISVRMMPDGYAVKIAAK